MEHNMIKAYDRNDEKLYGEFQALKNQSVHTNAYRDDKRFTVLLQVSCVGMLSVVPVMAS